MPPKSKTTSSKLPTRKQTTRKTAVKREISLSDHLKRLFSSLCAQIDNGHFTNAVKTCDKILRLEPGDKDALQTKLFLLLQTEQYDTALTLIGSGGDQHAFERAYSLYRLQRESEAGEVLHLIKSSKEGAQDRGVMYLEAQLNYRGGSYQSAFDAYNQLLDTTESQTEEHADILTNLQASQKQLDFINKDYLRALDTLPNKLTTTLESIPPPAQPNSSLAVAIASSRAVAEVEDNSPKKVKKVRMSRVPAGVTPGLTPPPDPERWLKKSERTAFAQGSRRRKGGGGGATQGSTMDSVPAGNVTGHTAKSSGGSKGKKKK